MKREIDKLDDHLASWLNNQPHFVHEVTADVQMNLRAILDRFPRLVDSKKNRSIADPRIIAHAIAREAVVVTKELPAGLNAKAPKIPDACNHFRIRWLNDFELARDLGIRFSAHLTRGSNEQ